MTILYKKYRKYYYLFIVPAFVLYVLALLMPLFLGTIPYSFQKYREQCSWIYHRIFSE